MKYLKQRKKIQRGGVLYKPNAEGIIALPDDVAETLNANFHNFVDENGKPIAKPTKKTRKPKKEAEADETEVDEADAEETVEDEAPADEPTEENTALTSTPVFSPQGNG